MQIQGKLIHSCFDWFYCMLREETMEFGVWHFWHRAHWRDLNYTVCHLLLCGYQVSQTSWLEVVNDSQRQSCPLQLIIFKMIRPAPLLSDCRKYWLKSDSGKESLIWKKYWIHCLFKSRQLNPLTISINFCFSVTVNISFFELVGVK